MRHALSRFKHSGRVRMRNAHGHMHKVTNSFVGGRACQFGTDQSLAVGLAFFYTSEDMRFNFRIKQVCEYETALTAPIKNFKNAIRCCKEWDGLDFCPIIHPKLVQPCLQSWTMDMRLLNLPGRFSEL